ncbi:nitrile hydratase accessory protein [Nocardioides zeae]|uniref:Nitrile hydratase accessory protein n=2 Tax=Nocardioides zeae TaxID=1457234 RepID=A0ACC6ILI0_9ACTN|nr:nitrile hydratase accessory protein [Nocardioides zeae]MDQ1106409.1 nitrile hydratase accessory protein [Nocardioides zeae]MDR6173905.1 nitrile hydratase accessory protein [Nocardioides zeae]MDR6211539.1 nitrile hydratase accessory protein [Nocardioides zeae]
MATATTLPPPYTDPAELSRARAAVEQLVCGLPGATPGATPGQDGFEHPWEIRSFAMAVAAHERLGFDWAQFQGALIASIDAWEGADPATRGPWSYYEHWVAALESVMAASGVLDGTVLEVRTQDVLAVPANRNHHEAHLEPIAVDPAR